jgi:hypothetical protein
MIPPPQTNAVACELGRLAFRLGLLERGAPDWTALARACGVSSAALFAIIAREGWVDEETLFPMLDGILALTSDLDPRYNTLPLLMALGVITPDDLEALWDQWRASLMRAEFGNDPRSSA